MSESGDVLQHKPVDLKPDGVAPVSDEPPDAAADPAAPQSDTSLQVPDVGAVTQITAIGEGIAIGDGNKIVVIKLSVEFLDRLERDYGDAAITALLRKLHGLQEVAGLSDEVREQAGNVEAAVQDKTVAEIRQDQHLLEQLGWLLIHAAGFVILSEVWDWFKGQVATRATADPLVAPVVESSAVQNPEPVGSVKPSRAEVDPGIDFDPQQYDPRFEPELVHVPAGWFLMGSDLSKDDQAYEDEQPQHRRYLRDYYIGRTLVTNVQYYAFVFATRRQAPPHWEGGKPVEKVHHPVVHISWYDAVAYCEWLADFTHKPYRLPTEAEWEKAARGTEGWTYPWDNRPPSRHLCNYDGNVDDTTPVGAYSPQGDSVYGCADMAGNVWEWTGTAWQVSYEDYDPELSVSGAAAVRGGAFLDYEWCVRCACRSRYNPNFHFNYLGFRVVCGAPHTSDL